MASPWLCCEAGSGVSACTGECCLNLAFDVGPDGWDDKNDGGIIADMLLPVTQEDAALYKEHFFPFGRGISTKTAQHHYLCRHWDESTRLCGIHDSKPEVCRDYPYDAPCVYCGFEESEDVIAKWRKVHVRPRKRKRGLRVAAG